ncbi:hypothetical protein HY950_00930 [Candidatus Gottesmanbacteria bacterium]|nr:hypothetical protein [Candidatus Gottesmanbacteria bacterium]
MKLLAQITNPVLPQTLGGGDKGHTIDEGTVIVGKLISNIVGLVFIFAFFLAFLYLLTGSIQWITSGGDKSTLETARNKIIHALMGLIITAAAWAIVKLAGQFLGLDILALPLPVIK